MPKAENKQIIAVDIDEVIFPTVVDLIDYVDREHSVKMTMEDFATYHLEDVWPGGPEEGAEIIKAYIKQVPVEIAPIKGAAEALAKLSERYELIIMTARDPAASVKTQEWLSRHFPEQFKDTHFVGNRHDSKTWRSKAEVCKELGVTYLIDDLLTTVLDANEAGVKALLFGDYPWNRAETLPDGVTRVKD
ncbi:MAG TPA: hypothetical protein VHD84_01755, partial [Candidatus Saccharimonadales bacterium]|nr:hypothetical protein [Candidatus Saccharimonadales bacterium]